MRVASRARRGGAMSHYVIRGGVEGKKRLEVLSRTLWPSTSRVLERAGLGEGMRCVDLGCGGGDVTVELARRIDPRGHATGIDMDETKLALARDEARARQLTNLDFVRADIGAWRDEDAFDLVYCRFLLTHLDDPLDLMRRMWRALRRGGRVVVEDIDMSGSFTHPPCPAYDRYVELYRAAVAKRGGDADIGPKLYGFTRSAGWRDVELEVVAPAFARGDGKQVSLLTLINVTQAVLDEGLASEAELHGITDELAAFTAADDTIVSLPRIFQLHAVRG